MNELLSLHELFINKIFRIPDYQRGYSWSNQQLDEFFEDLMLLRNNKDHYTGMISLKKLNSEYTKDWINEKWLIENWDYSAYHIVDGQQRLTTFIILINTIINFYKDKNKDKKNDEIFINSIPLSKIESDYLVIEKPDSGGIVKTYKFGYEIDNPSYEYFKNKILNDSDSSDIEETFYTLNLENTKNYFTYKLESLYEIDEFSTIEDIFKKLTRRLKFNIYNIDDDFNVFVAFETMNNRGKRLSHLELLKNRLIYLSTLFENSDETSIIVRNNINETWKTIYSYLGKNKSMPLNDDEFLQAHWIIYFGYTRTNKETYNTFLLNNYFSQRRITSDNDNIHYENNETVDELSVDDNINYDDDVNDVRTSTLSEMKKGELKLEDINNYVNSLKALIPFWYNMNFPDTSNFCADIKLYLNRINRLGLLYFKPLITVLLSKKNIEDKDKIVVLQLIERFIFLQFRYAGYLSTYKNSFYYGLTKKLYYDDLEIEELIKELNTIDILSSNNVLDISTILTPINRWFKNYKGYYSWNSIRYFLYEYEYELAYGKAADKLEAPIFFKKDEKDKVSIEHIYPQTDTNDYWQERFGSFSESEKKRIVNTLGNLLPLSMSINASLQNDSFVDKKYNGKRRGYADGTHSELEVAMNDDWNINTILNRGLKMLSFMEKRFNFKFHNREDKLKALGLDFLIKEEDKYIDFNEVINEEIVSEKNVSFSEEQFQLLTKNIPDYLLDIYNELDSYILNLNEKVQKNSTTIYVSYLIDKSFIEIRFQMNNLFITLMPGSYNDPYNLVTSIGENYNWVNNNKMNVSSFDNIEDVKDLIKQSFYKSLGK